MKIIRQTYKIKSPVVRVWLALTNSEDIAAWGGGPAKMNAKEGAAFSLWGGDIHGKNIEVIPKKKLVQAWYGGDWPKPSKLSILLREKKGVTEIKITHAGVPAGEFEDISEGWRDYYLGPMKEYLEN